MERDATIKRYQKSQFSKSKRNQTGNEQIQASWRRLKFQFKREHDLQRSSTSWSKNYWRKSCYWCWSYSRKRKLVRNTVIFERPTKLFIAWYFLIKLSLGISQVLRERQKTCSYSFAIALKTLWMTVHVANSKIQQPARKFLLYKI